MTRNYKLYFKYLYFNLPHFYLQQLKRGSQNISIVVSKSIFYYSSLHLRFSSLFFSTQLVDLFAYELPMEKSVLGSTETTSLSKIYSESILVYNFHNLMYQDRFYFFCIDSSKKANDFSINSISEVFPNASWLEREVSELHGVIFNNKKDLRNLLLQYGDTTTPFQKSAPSIGFKEVFYDSVNDVLVESAVSVQV